MASGGKCDSAASSLPRVGVAGPSRSQESPVLAQSAPPSVDSSALGERDPRLRSSEVGGSSGATPTLALPGPVCHMQAGLGKGDVVPTRGLGGLVAGLASRSLTDECALAGARHAPGPSLRTATGAVGFAPALGVTIRGLDESARALRAAAGSAVIVCDHEVPAIGPVTICGHGTSRFSPRTGPGHVRGAGGQGGVARIVRRLMVSPRIMAILGCGWSLLLRLQTAPSLSTSCLCRISPGCSSACQGPVNSGMRLQALRFWLLLVPVLGRCLVPLHRCR